ncbi:thioredoxin domain-containing protein [Maribacter antarcticus]|uniref:thioredoxin domain-containing protein n=1 Tax=Maribacter antarcticus TaxID=505250 RepID=UPI00047880E1|nr:thioredoxin domain-containing protein [Maribacter antarcticus]
MPKKFTNSLIKETSPYLLQHAHNPVDWHPWREDILKDASVDNKLLLISIGYAACHWCHIMEQECFEDETVANTMNTNFINIKIDREERPDIDHIYMDALQIMTGSGGWPLNILALPDGRPFWGASYVKKEDWIKVLSQLQALYIADPQKVIGFAENMANGITEINKVTVGTATELMPVTELSQMVLNWSDYFDTFLGGYKRAPKFMMPVNLTFLLHYSHEEKDDSISDYVNTTLTRMAWGGIYDHVGGGFSRYAVDTKWHVPHFEKMLYDNAQLVSLYAKAYAKTKNELYKRVVTETIQFLEEELLAANNGFYSSLDADSTNSENKLEEGAYYVWKEKELKSLLGTQYSVFKDYYNINTYGYWEHANYVLIRDATKEQIATKHGLTISVLETRISDCLFLLKKERNLRDKPRLDNKILTSWNGLLLKGITDAYRYLGDDRYLELALKNGNFIVTHLMAEDGKLIHTYTKNKETINGFLEDYAAVIAGFIGLYEVSFDMLWLTKAALLTEYVYTYFLDEATGLFFFTSKEDALLVRRTLEVSDNVVPASNSMMAINLFKLSKFGLASKYAEHSLKMMQSMEPAVKERPENHANWLSLLLLHQKPFYEIAIVGENYLEKRKELCTSYIPQSIICGSEHEGVLSLLKNRYNKETTQIFICEEGACKLPLTRTEEVLILLVN